MINEIMKRLSELPNVTLSDGQEYIQLYDAMETVKRALEQHSWIPVTERLPNIHNSYQDYLITNKNKLVGRAFFTNMNGKQWWSVDDVIAWMPLPKPYEPQENCDTCRYKDDGWDSEHCDGCCGNHSGFEPQESEE